MLQNESFYPRPRFRRNSFFSLNGLWDFGYHKDGAPTDKCPQKICVPFPPESALSGIAERHDRKTHLFYQKRFSLPQDFHGEKDLVLLHFGAVDQICEVTLNGTVLGRHEGGYLPFSFEISKHLSEGENLLTVRAWDALDHTLPYGKQKEKNGGMWYTPFSGIWQDVWLEAVPRDGIFDVTVSSDDTSATIRIKSTCREHFISYCDGEETVTLPFHDEITITPKNPRLWSPEDPYLYRFTVYSESDRAESYFALRRLEVRYVGETARFFLNGAPYLLHGVLDQGYFHDGISTPHSPQEYEKDILRMKELGFNTLRKHIKLEPPAFYEACDRLGMIVMQDAVNNGKYSFLWQTALPTIGFKSLPRIMIGKSKAAKRVFEEHTLAMLKEISFYPSVLLFTIFNEGWGQANTDALYDACKAAFAHLIYDTASGWFYPRKSDVQSEHVYFKKIKPIRPKGKLPIILSEFGGFSYPIEGHTFYNKKNYGYGTCKSQDEFSARVDALYQGEVLPAVKAGLCALIYTQLSDIEDETNGFYTYDRKICKAEKERMQKIAAALMQAYRDACK